MIPSTQPQRARIFLTDSAYFTVEAGVYRYDLEYGLDEELMTDVSDHYPVYAEFRVNGMWTDQKGQNNTTEKKDSLLVPNKRLIKAKQILLLDNVTNRGTSLETGNSW